MIGCTTGSTVVVVLLFLHFPFPMVDAVMAGTIGTTTITTSTTAVPVPVPVPIHVPIDTPTTNTILYSSNVPRSFATTSSTPSTIPSTFPSTIPSDMPSGDVSQQQSSIVPTIEGPMFFINEDAVVQLGLDELDLIGYSNIQSWTNRMMNDNDDEPPNVLFDRINDQEYVIDNANTIGGAVVPYTDLFDPDNYDITNDGLHVTNRRSNETFANPIFRSSLMLGRHNNNNNTIDDANVTYNNETAILQFATNEMGNLSFAEIRVMDPSSVQSDVFFIPSDVLRENYLNSTLFGEDSTIDEDENILVSFTSDNVDNEKFGTIFDLDEVEPPFVGNDVVTTTSTSTSTTPTTNTPSRLRRVLRSLVTLDSDNSTDVDDDDNDNGDDSNTVATICDRFQIVKIAVVYDASLCQTYGSMAATRNRIISIVATASLYYEREICIKLQLTDIYTPDTSSCSRSNSFTNRFNTNSACRGDDNLLSDFTEWIRERRNSLGIDRTAIIHLLTGADKVTSTIGCAFTSSYCTGFPYGVEYATFSSNLLAQATVFAHEVAHNLGAPHIADNNNRFEYIMEASISSGSDGFGSSSSNTIRNYLSRVSCDASQPTGNPPPTNSPPRPSPSPPVPTKPSSPTPPSVINGCSTTPEVSAPKCVAVGNVKSEDGYACYSLNQILPEDCDSVQWSISTCNGITIRNSPRLLLSSSSSSSSSSSLNATLTFDDDEVTMDDDILQEDQSSSLIFNPTSGSSCSKQSCIFSTKNRICLLASASSSMSKHSIIYKAIDSSNDKVIRTLERIIPIAKNNNDGSCRPANLRCR